MEQDSGSPLTAPRSTLPANSSPLPAPRYYYEQINLGYNYCMTELQAALGLSQLRRLDKFVFRRQELAKRYDRLLADLPLITPWQHPDTYSAWHLYVIHLKYCEITPSRREVFDYLRQQGIGVNVHYIPVHLQPYHISGERGAESSELKAENKEKNEERHAPRHGLFPEAEKYYQEAITLPLYPDMTEEMQDKVSLTLRDILKIY